MNTMTKSFGAVETTCARTRVWRVQPALRRLAVSGAPVQGSTLPISGKNGYLGQVALPIAGVPAPATLSNSTFMDVPPFRTGRPPV